MNNDWQWLFVWHKNLPKYFTFEVHIIAVLSLTLIFLSYKKRIIPPKLLLLPLSALVLNTIYWFLMAPDPRYLGPIPQLITMILLYSIMWNLSINNVNKNQMLIQIFIFLFTIMFWIYLFALKSMSVDNSLGKLIFLSYATSIIFTMTLDFSIPSNKKLLLKAACCILLTLIFIRYGKEIGTLIAKGKTGFDPLIIAKSQMKESKFGFRALVPLNTDQCYNNPQPCTHDLKPNLAESELVVLNFMKFKKYYIIRN